MPITAIVMPKGIRVVVVIVGNMTTWAIGVLILFFVSKGLAVIMTAPIGMLHMARWMMTDQSQVGIFI